MDKAFLWQHIIHESISKVSFNTIYTLSWWKHAGGKSISNAIWIFQESHDIQSGEVADVQTDVNDNAPQLSFQPLPSFQSYQHYQSHAYGIQTHNSSRHIWRTHWYRQKVLRFLFTWGYLSVDRVVCSNKQEISHKCHDCNIIIFTSSWWLTPISR